MVAARSSAVARRGRDAAAPHGQAPRVVTDPRVLRPISYVHSCVYLALLYFAFVNRNDGLVSVLGWTHGLLWIGMSLLCLLAVRRRQLPLWLGTMVAVVGGIGPFAGSCGFFVEKRRVQRRHRHPDPAILG